ncbi:EAL domain-containing protein [Halobacillus yeomjeoni]|uniref:EAL domain-containing protein n=1 Tax=Halobacillus yeomjeoni TaxID=311194 RepID=A0A931HX00_9BACI|nr:EAL domain-containing protein [Halobacillus yeomjeoni]MBH0230973.1 EAL domain-containing protein [Halobacillus yeomjeoni]
MGRKILTEKTNQSTNDISPMSQNNLLNIFTSSLEGHPEIVYVFDKNLNPVYQNKNFNHLLGYQESSPDLFEHLTEGETQQLTKMIDSSLQGMNSYTTLQISAHSYILNIEVTSIPIKDSNDVIGAYLIIKDTTPDLHLKNDLSITEDSLSIAQQSGDITSWEYEYSTGQFKVSESIYELFSLPKKEETEWTLQLILDRIAPGDLEKVTKAIEKSIAEQTEGETDFKAVLTDGTIRYIEASWKFTMTLNGEILLVGGARDVTNEKEWEMKQSVEKEQITHMYDSLEGFLVWEYDFLQQKITYVSGGTEDIFDMARQSFIDDHDLWMEKIHPEDKDFVHSQLKKLREGHAVFYQFRFVNETGVISHLETQSFPRFNLEGEITQFFSFVRNITVSKSIEELQTFNASHDYLTQLFNRNHFHETITTLSSDPTTPYALMYLGLKRFSSINETLGFQIGDAILLQVADKLRSLGKEDIYLARISGSTFAIVYKNFHDEQAVYDLATHLLDNIDPHFHIKDYELYINISIGITFFPHDDTDPNHLIQLAMFAMQRAKQLEGHNYQVHYQTNDLVSYKKYVLEKDLRQAIKQEQLELYYQPRVNPSSGVINGFEALIRWNHKEWGVVRPNEFIPLAEESHLITDISYYVIEQACKQLEEWTRQGLPKRLISVNVSPLCFLKKRLVDHTEECLKRYNVDGKWLEIELTETTLMKNEQIVLQAMEKLRGLGVKMALDDFGTGFSSLSYIRKFPIETIKIDKSFMDKVGEKSTEGTNGETSINKDEHLVATIVYMANGMGMNVVAEGVENEQQLAFTKQIECSEAQGYLFSKPLKAEELLPLLERGTVPPKIKKEKKQKEERRSYFRLEFDAPLRGNMLITEVRGKAVQTGNTEILIKDISVGGLKFTSSLNLPVRPDIKMKFQIHLMGETLDVFGKVVWKNEMKHETYDYGVEFKLNVPLQDKLAQIINKASVYQHKKKDLPKTPVINENPHTYLYKKMKK